MVDTDGDGRITRSEYYACFDLLDANGDGLVTRAEVCSRMLTCADVC